MIGWAGIELLLGTQVTAANVKASTLLTAAGETISYATLIIATGARVSDFPRFRFVDGGVDHTLGSHIDSIQRVIQLTPPPSKTEETQTFLNLRNCHK